MTVLTNTTTKKAPKHTQFEGAPGIRINAGPFIGIIKNNIDPMRSGRVQVWIPELGGDADDQNAWRTVSYCTPFYGVTDFTLRGKTQDFQESPHAYGMWMVPPDVGVKVLCTFVNGDPFKGFWFGCIPEWPNLHMVPGLSSGSWHGGGPEPLVDFNDGDPAATGTEGDFYKRASTPHEYQTKVWQRQGLLQDPARGPGTSSAFREVPSRVFGISTPGPELGTPTGNDTSTYQQAELGVRARQGGHQFVMDDGDVNGNNQLIRLRTSNGNMLLLNDSAGMIYMINSNGSAWFEMDATGNVKVFSQGQLAMHASGGISLDTPGALSLSGGTVNIFAKGSLGLSGMTTAVKGTATLSLGSAGPMSLTSGMKINLSANMCIGLNSLMHVDIVGGCVTLNTSIPKPAIPPIPSFPPPPGPSHEPYGGHVNSRTNSPSTSPSYGATHGVPQGPAGSYGASSSFGLTAGVPTNYGVLTNQIGPIKFNPGLQASYAGQASNLGIAADYNVYDKTAILYTNTTLDLPVATSGFAVNINDPGAMKSANLTAGEKLNNPGMIKNLESDPFAVGQVNGLNVYSTPEEGIAALTLMLDLVQASGARTVSDFIQGYVARKGKVI